MGASHEKSLFKKTLSLFALGLGLAAVSDAALAESTCRTANNFRSCITQNGVNQPATITVTNLTGYPATVQEWRGVNNCAYFGAGGCYGAKNFQNTWVTVNYAPGQTKSSQTMRIPKGRWAISSNVWPMSGNMFVASHLLISR